MKTIKQQVLDEVDRKFKDRLVSVVHDNRTDFAIDLILAKVLKCKVCKEEIDFNLLSVECPDCYIEGAKKEQEKCLAKVKAEINKIEKRERKRYEKESKKCVENAYDPEKDDWNPKHFNRCDGDVTTGKLDILEELKIKWLNQK